jgi:FdhD protein
MGVMSSPIRKPGLIRSANPDEDEVGRQAERPPAEIAVGVARLRDGAWSEDSDALAAEEPLEIRLTWGEDGAIERKSLAVTMRTPGDDFALAAGFLYGEGIVRMREDIVDVAFCQDEDEEQRFNIVTVTLRPGLTFDTARLQRNVFATSSCGVCGKANLEALAVMGCELVPDGFSLAPELVQAFPQAIRQAQGIFSRTGGLHAAALFAPDGTIVSLKEDIGRHNALDKVIGAELLAGRAPLNNRGVVLSGRAGFELLQKALVARIPVVIALGAPSSLAASLANEFGITLVGFTRPDSFNVYSRPDRIRNAAIANGAARG